MKVLFYSSSKREAGKRLQRAIEMLISKDGIEIYRKLNNLALGLRRPFSEPFVVVLLASSREDLMDILSLQDLLSDMRIILILPDGEHDTVAMGHTLRPRFISYCDSDFLEVSGVLCRMMSKLKSHEKRQLSEDYPTIY